MTGSMSSGSNTPARIQQNTMNAEWPTARKGLAQTVSQGQRYNHAARAAPVRDLASTAVISPSIVAAQEICKTWSVVVGGNCAGLEIDTVSRRPKLALPETLLVRVIEWRLRGESVRRIKSCTAHTEVGGRVMRYPPRVRGRMIQVPAAVSNRIGPSPVAPGAAQASRQPSWRLAHERRGCVQSSRPQRCNPRVPERRSDLRGSPWPQGFGKRLDSPAHPRAAPATHVRRRFEPFEPCRRVEPSSTTITSTARARDTCRSTASTTRPICFSLRAGTTTDTSGQCTLESPMSKCSTTRGSIHAHFSPGQSVPQAAPCSCH